LFIQNDFLFPLYLYGGKPPEQISHGFIRNKKNVVDYTVNEGLVKINEEKYEIFSLEGHAPGQIGIATRDRVCYLGDALFSQENIAKYSFPFLFDIGEQYKTFDKIVNLDFDFFVLGHAGRIYQRDDLINLMEINRANLDNYLNICLELLEQPHSREELLEEIIILQELSPEISEYYFISSTLVSMLSYLIGKNLIEYQLENGRLFYFRAT
jgi:glyoxylase-like metal-dependent hydrolase (beta-lactamase superfamily II)